MSTNNSICTFPPAQWTWGVLLREITKQEPWLFKADDILNKRIIIIYLQKKVMRKKDIASRTKENMTKDRLSTQLAKSFHSCLVSECWTESPLNKVLMTVSVSDFISRLTVWVARWQLPNRGVTLLWEEVDVFRSNVRFTCEALNKHGTVFSLWHSTRV